MSPEGFLFKALIWFWKILTAGLKSKRAETDKANNINELIILARDCEMKGNIEGAEEVLDSALKAYPTNTLVLQELIALRGRIKSGQLNEKAVQSAWLPHQPEESNEPEQTEEVEKKVIETNKISLLNNDERIAHVDRDVIDRNEQPVMPDEKTIIHPTPAKKGRRLLRRLLINFGVSLIIVFVILLIIGFIGAILMPEEVPTGANKSNTAYIQKSPLLTLRKCPSLKCEEIVKVPLGNKVEIVSCTVAGWCRIKSTLGEGYVPKSAIGSEKPLLAYSDRVALAQHYLRLEKYDEALIQARRAHRLKVKVAYPFILTTAAYLAKGMTAKAWKTFVAALKIGITGPLPLPSIVVKVRALKTELLIPPQDIRSVSGKIIRLKNGSLYHGDMQLQVVWDRKRRKN